MVLVGTRSVPNYRMGLLATGRPFQIRFSSCIVLVMHLDIVYA
jgi:hypothetical protein